MPVATQFSYVSTGLGIVFAMVILMANPRRALNHALAMLLFVTSIYLFFRGRAVSFGPFHPGGEMWFRLLSATTPFIIGCYAWGLRAIARPQDVYRRLSRASWLWIFLMGLMAFIPFGPFSELVPGEKRYHRYPVYYVCVFAHFWLYFTAIWSFFTGKFKQTPLMRHEARIMSLIGALALFLGFGVGGLAQYVHGLQWSHFVLSVLMVLWTLALLFVRRKVLGIRETLTVVIAYGVLIALVGGAGVLFATWIWTPGASVMFALVTAPVVVLGHNFIQGRLNLTNARRFKVACDHLAGLGAVVALGSLIEQMEGFMAEWGQVETVRILIGPAEHPEAFHVPARSVPVALHREVLASDRWLTPEFLVRSRAGRFSPELLQLFSTTRSSLVVAVPAPAGGRSLLLVFGPRRSLQPFATRMAETAVDLAQTVAGVLARALLQQEMRVQERRAVIGVLGVGFARTVRGTLPSVQNLVRKVSTGGVALGNEARRALVSIREVENMVGQILKVTQPRHMTLVSCQAHDLALSALKAVQSEADASGVKLVGPLPAPSLAVMVDATLCDGLIHLLRNAIEAASGRPSPQVEMQVLEAGGNVIFSVADNGAGVPAGFVEQLFRPFATTKAHRSGLSLTLADKIAKDHRGRIQLLRTSDQGTEFTLALPLAVGGTRP